jgi:hypothetical protein
MRCKIYFRLCLHTRATTSPVRARSWRRSRPGDFSSGGTSSPSVGLSGVAGLYSFAALEYTNPKVHDTSRIKRIATFQEVFCIAVTHTPRNWVTFWELGVQLNPVLIRFIGKNQIKDFSML